LPFTYRQLAAVVQPIGVGPRPVIQLESDPSEAHVSGMSWMNQIADVLQNYSQAGVSTPPADVDTHFNQVAQAAPKADLANGLAAMFRSNQTAPFGQMVGQLFGNSNGNQRANLLNTLLVSGAGTGALSQIMQSTGIAMPASGAMPQVTPEQAARVSPEAVQQAAAHAQEHDPTIIDRVSQVYAEHPMLVKTLGAVAMSMALSHFANRRH
jgi:hypothetical protein